jgi:hypothetical protein
VEFKDIIKYDHKGTKGHKVITKLPQRLASISSLFHPNHLIKRGFQTVCNCKLGYHDSCTLCKSSTMYPRVVISSLAKRLQRPHFAILTLPLVYGPEITTCHYKGLLQEYVMLCYGFLNKWSPLVVLKFPAQASPLAPCGSGSSQSISQSMITK